MRRIFAFLTLALALNASASVTQQGGEQGLYRSASIQGIERGLAMYLNGEEIQSILTPGETVDWKLTLKTGEIVVADARSEAFDPGLEVVDAAGKTMSNNDDRYPGDQRPLIFWRCPTDGTYLLRVRSFRDKSGGQVMVRFKTYQSMDVPGAAKVDATFDATKPFMVRVPMKAGEIKEITADSRGEGNFLTFRFEAAIFPNGLPERSPSLSELISPAVHGLIAPVDGDYYYLAVPYGYVGGAGRVRIGAREIVPTKPAQQGSGFSAKATTNTPALWELSVKAGDLLEASVPDLNVNCKFVLAETPDFSKFSTAKPETNPFFPVLRNQPAGDGPAFEQLPKRAGDNRIVVFQARRNATLWLATDGLGAANQQFSMAIKPAAAELAENKANAGKLRIASTDYWAFDAKAGDVMTLGASTVGFSQLVIVRDPDLQELRHSEAGIDQTSDAWRMVAQKPGRYLVAIACLGNGGGGEYKLTREVFHAKEFSMTTPAAGEIAPGQTQIWKFVATPNNPLLIHWSSSNWDYDVAIYNEKGEPSDFQRTDIDAHNRFGLLKVDRPLTFILVLTGGSQKASYSIDLSRIPGAGKG